MRRWRWSEWLVEERAMGAAVELFRNGGPLDGLLYGGRELPEGSLPLRLRRKVCAAYVEVNVWWGGKVV